jgi:hypothetical protein
MLPKLIIPNTAPTAKLIRLSEDVEHSMILLQNLSGIGNDLITQTHTNKKGD